jgi:hypothetical protein
MGPVCSAMESKPSMAEVGSGSSKLASGAGRAGGGAGRRRLSACAGRLATGGGALGAAFGAAWGADRGQAGIQIEEHRVARRRVEIPRAHERAVGYHLGLRHRLGQHEALSPNTAA